MPFSTLSIYIHQRISVKKKRLHCSGRINVSKISMFYIKKLPLVNIFVDDWINKLTFSSVNSTDVRTRPAPSCHLLQQYLWGKPKLYHSDATIPHVNRGDDLVHYHQEVDLRTPGGNTAVTCGHFITLHRYTTAGRPRQTPM